MVTEGPAPDASIAEGWKGTISRVMPPEERASVECVVVRASKLFVITAYGETTVRIRKRPNPPGSRDTGDEEDGDDQI